MGKKKARAEPVDYRKSLTDEEANMYILFDFAYYLENLPRGNVTGATQLLRTFLAELNDKKD